MTQPNLAAALREAADLLDENPELPAPRVHIAFHECADETIAAIIAALPDLKWEAKRGQTSDWVEARAGRVEWTAFAKTAVARAPRLASLVPVRDVEAAS